MDIEAVKELNESKISVKLGMFACMIRNTRIKIRNKYENKPVGDWFAR